MSGVVLASAGIGGDIHTISIADVTVDEIVTDPADATASYSLENDGDIVVSSGADPGDWIVPLSSFPDYECKMDVVSGTVTSGTTGSYLELGTTRTWTKARTTPGTAQFIGTLTIRRASDLVVLDTATITLKATVGV